MVAFIIIILLLILFLFLKAKYFHSVSKENAMIYTGGIGAGKTYVSVRIAIKRYKESYRKYWFRRYVLRCKNLVPPAFYSTIPVRYRPTIFHRPRFSKFLTKPILLMQEEIPLYSIMLIDEIELLISQFLIEFDGKSDMEQFITLYRQATKGGTIILNTQSINKCNHIVRYCLNSGFILNKLFSFRVPFTQFSIYCGTASKVDVTTKKSELEIDEEGYMFHEPPKIVLFFQSEKHYDTYAYYNYYISKCDGKDCSMEYNDYHVTDIIQFEKRKKTNQK